MEPRQRVFSIKGRKVELVIPQGTPTLSSLVFRAGRLAERGLLAASRCVALALLKLHDGVALNRLLVLDFTNLTHYIGKYLGQIVDRLGFTHVR